MPVQEKTLVDCRQYITQLSLEYQDVRRALYDDRLAFFLEDHVLNFAGIEQVDNEQVFISRLASLFYPMGFRINMKDPQKAIWGLARQFLIEQSVSDKVLNEVESALVQSYRQVPQTIPAQLLTDALIGIYFDDEHYNWASLRQLETQLIKGETNRLAQAQLRLQELLSIRFSTNAGRRHWQEKLGQQLLLQKKKVEKLLRDNSSNEFATPTPKVNFSQIEEGKPIRAAQTFFRSVYRNHINLSAIADNKANIMISVNSILISVLITFLSYRNIAETQPMILLPVIIFLVVGLSSLVFAVLSARPKVTTSPKDINASSQNMNIAFFGSFVQMPIEDYEEKMNEVLNDSALLYRNMVRDLYLLGKVLDKKYRYLSISYNIFMLGLVVTVGLFLFTLF